MPRKPSAPAARVRALLEAANPNPRCELDFQEPWQLLIATILSAQTTDKTVNRVTPRLFLRWKTPRALAEASQEDVEEEVRPTGFYRNKAKAIRETAHALMTRFGGEVPRTLDELVTLSGVARKTANVVLGTAFGLTEGFTVDTHVGRVARRLGFTKEEDPGKVEQRLMTLFPKESWIDLSHRIVLHGRYICLAKAPLCSQCPLNEICPSAVAEPTRSLEERIEGEARAIATRTSP